MNMLFSGTSLDLSRGPRVGLRGLGSGVLVVDSALGHGLLPDAVGSRRAWLAPGESIFGMDSAIAQVAAVQLQEMAH